jgi:hypothetical protein
MNQTIIFESCSTISTFQILLLVEIGVLIIVLIINCLFKKTAYSENKINFEKKSLM